MELADAPVPAGALPSRRCFERIKQRAGEEAFTAAIGSGSMPPRLSRSTRMAAFRYLGAGHSTIGVRAAVVAARDIGQQHLHDVWHPLRGPTGRRYAGTGAQKREKLGNQCWAVKLRCSTAQGMSKVMFSSCQSLSGRACQTEKSSDCSGASSILISRCSIAERSNRTRARLRATPCEHGRRRPRSLGH